MKLEFHHINYVSKDVDAFLKFYVDILKLEDIAPQNFPRTDPTDKTGYDGYQVCNRRHYADASRGAGLMCARNGRHINPVERGHIAFRTDDIKAFKAHLSANGIEYADYGTAFAAEWHQIFFYDPEGNIIEVHQQLA